MTDIASIGLCSRCNEAPATALRKAACKRCAVAFHSYNASLKNKREAQLSFDGFSRQRPFKQRMTVRQPSPSPALPTSEPSITEKGRAYDSDAFLICGEEMRVLMDRVKRAAASSETVLICGESGVGKELVAHALHQLSPRAGKSFGIVDCGAIPETLMERELFGHERGAFTDAHVGRSGILRAADGGTLLIDEIGDLPLALQPKLLRVLETRAFRPLGATRYQYADIRVIAATNKDLSAMVRAKAFREDLYYRVAAIPLVVPPLRDRAGEVRELARFFLAKEESEKRFSDEALMFLEHYAWPGNVRELKNAVSLLRTFAMNTTITEMDVASLLPHIRGSVVAKSVSALVATSGTLEELQKQYFAQLLVQTRGTMTRVAAIAGIPRPTVYVWLKRLGLYQPRIERYRAE